MYRRKSDWVLEIFMGKELKDKWTSKYIVASPGLRELACGLVAVN
jgi:hypothetical protein